MYPPTVKRLINNCHTDYYKHNYYVYNKVAYCNLSRILSGKLGQLFILPGKRSPSNGR